jgi:hypothetical protein
MPNAPSPTSSPRSGRAHPPPVLRAHRHRDNHHLRSSHPPFHVERPAHSARDRSATATRPTSSPTTRMPSSPHAGARHHATLRCLSRLKAAAATRRASLRRNSSARASQRHMHHAPLALPGQPAFRVTHNPCPSGAAPPFHLEQGSPARAGRHPGLVDAKSPSDPHAHGETLKAAALPTKQPSTQPRPSAGPVPTRPNSARIHPRPHRPLRSSRTPRGTRPTQTHIRTERVAPKRTGQYEQTGTTAGMASN